MMALMNELGFSEFETTTDCLSQWEPDDYEDKNAVKNVTWQLLGSPEFASAIDQLFGGKEEP